MACAEKMKIWKESSGKSLRPWLRCWTNEAAASGPPVVSVDTKKKELVGDFKNGGQEWRPQGQPELVRAYDFVDKKPGKGIPYGVYDQTA